MSKENGESPALELLDFIEPILKLLIAVGVLFGIQRIAVNFQPTQRVEIPIPPLSIQISVADILTAIIILLIAIAIIKFANDLGNVFAKYIPEFPAIKGIILLTGSILALFIVHQMSKWIVTDYIQSYMDQYDLVFLIIGIILAGRLALILYMNVDEITDLIRQGFESPNE